MKNLFKLHNHRFLFFAPPGGPEGLSSEGNETGEKIGEINSALQKADELLATDVNNIKRGELEDARKTVAELKNNISAGSLDADQNEQLNYALNVIREFADANVAEEMNPVAIAAETKGEADKSVKKANSNIDGIMAQLAESDAQFMENLDSATERTEDDTKA